METTVDATTTPPVQQGYCNDLMKRSQAASYLGLANRTLAIWDSQAYIAQYGRKLKSIKVGRLVRYRKSDLDAYLNAQTR